MYKVCKKLFLLFDKLYRVLPRKSTKKHTQGLLKAKKTTLIHSLYIYERYLYGFGFTIDYIAYGLSFFLTRNL